MAKALKISDDLFARLEATAQKRHLDSVESLLEAWQRTEDALRNQRAGKERIDEIRARLLATYGVQPDSVPLIRQDRER